MQGSHMHEPLQLDENDLPDPSSTSPDEGGVPPSRNIKPPRPHNGRYSHCDIFTSNCEYLVGEGWGGLMSGGWDYCSGSVWHQVVGPGKQELFPLGPIWLGAGLHVAPRQDQGRPGSFPS